MPRTRSSPAARRKKKRLLKSARGYVGGRARLLRTAIETRRRAMAYATRDRRVKKRTIRALWITRLNAAARQRGISYSRFIQGLTKSAVRLDRRIMAEIAVSDPGAFDEIVNVARTALANA